jgi:hypothetical protein
VGWAGVPLIAFYLLFDEGWNVYDKNQHYNNAPPQNDFDTCAVSLKAVTDLTNCTVLVALRCSK